jgi:hypothetical protein
MLFDSVTRLVELPVAEEQYAISGINRWYHREGPARLSTCGMLRQETIQMIRERLPVTLT